VGTAVQPAVLSPLAARLGLQSPLASPPPTGQLLLLGAGAGAAGQILAFGPVQPQPVRALAVQLASAVLRPPQAHVPSAAEDPTTSSSARRVRLAATAAGAASGAVPVRLVAIAAGSGAGVSLWTL